LDVNSAGEIGGRVGKLEEELGKLISGRTIPSPIISPEYDVA